MWKESLFTYIKFLTFENQNFKENNKKYKATILKITYLNLDLKLLNELIYNTDLKEITIINFKIKVIS